MPHTPSRSASVASTRNGLVKAHQPFRENDLERGKKTGKTVTKVRHDSDDFEPFEQVLDQAYTGDGGPRPVNKRSKQPNKFSQGHDEEYDNSGEVSMDIDSIHDSPSAYFHSVPTVHSNSKPSGSSSRPVTTSSRIDYDRIPSPNPAPRRSSVISTNRRGNSKPNNPSGLRTELYHEPNEFGRNRKDRSVDDMFDDSNMEEQSFLENQQPSVSHGNLSFTALAQDEDDNNFPMFDGDDDEDDQSSPPTRRINGKQRRISRSANDGYDVDMEDEIDEESKKIDQMRDEEEEPEEESHPSKKKKARKANGAPEPSSEPAQKRIKKAKAKSHSTKKPFRISIYDTLDEDGLRRSKRKHYPPLDYWRLEKVVWGRRENGPSVVPVIKEIIRIPKAQPESLGTNRRKKSARTRSKSAMPSDSPKEEIHIVEVDNPELGWDDQTQPNGIIWDYRLQTEVERRIAFPKRLVKTKVAQGENFSYDKIFGDGNFVAAGQLVIPPGAEKPTKPTKDNTYLFYIVEGAIECKIHRSSFVLATGGMFMVPRGNQYYIKNICERDVKLFFAQARKVPVEELDATPKVMMLARSPSAVRAKTVPQSSPKSK